MLNEKLSRYGTFGTHDALKLIALFSMFADHLGAFAYQDATWLRIIGRVSVPIFFFLIGYSRSYRIHADLVIGALILVGLKFAHTHFLADLNILVSFILARLFFIAAEKHPFLLKYPGVAFWILLLLWPMSEHWVQYGATGWMFALCGYAQKNADRYNVYSRFLMMFTSFWLFGVSHILEMRLLMPSALALALLLLVCGIVLWRYRPHALTLPANWRPIAPVLAWPARYSLWVYVVHLSILQLITGIY